LLDYDELSQRFANSSGHFACHVAAIGILENVSVKTRQKGNKGSHDTVLSQKSVRFLRRFSGYVRELETVK